MLGLAVAGLILWLPAGGAPSVGDPARANAAATAVIPPPAPGAPAAAFAANERLAAAPGAAMVVDGDTLRLQNDVVRLDGVAAPARGDQCDPAIPTDCAAAAAAQLAMLVHDHAVSCEVVGHDGLGRPSARCDIGKTNGAPSEVPSAASAAGSGISRDVAHADSLNQQIVLSGWARARTADLQPAELAARALHRGLWAPATESH
jgi:endonuclease YncB( thermonuclease family)